MGRRVTLPLVRGGMGGVWGARHTARGSPAPCDWLLTATVFRRPPRSANRRAAAPATDQYSATEWVWGHASPRGQSRPACLSGHGCGVGMDAGGRRRARSCACGGGCGRGAPGVWCGVGWAAARQRGRARRGDARRAGWRRAVAGRGRPRAAGFGGARLGMRERAVGPVVVVRVGARLDLRSCRVGWQAKRPRRQWARPVAGLPAAASLPVITSPPATPLAASPGR